MKRLSILLFVLLLLGGCVSNAPTTSSITVRIDNVASVSGLEVLVTIGGKELDTLLVAAGDTLPSGWRYGDSRSVPSEPTPTYLVGKGTNFKLTARLSDMAEVEENFVIKTVLGYPAVYSLTLVVEHGQIRVECWSSGDVEEQCNPN